MKKFLRARDMDMTKGPLLGKLLAVSFPLVLSGVLQLLFHAADLIVIGKFATESTTSLAAISSNAALINLLVNLSIGLSVGTNVVLSQAIGAGDARRASRTVHTSIALALCCGVAVAALGIGGSRYFLAWMKTDPAVMDKALVYLRIFLAGAPANILYNFGASILRAKGDTVRPLVYLGAAGVVNVGLNLVFVIIAHLDVGGVALATIIAQYLSCAAVMLTLLREKGYCRLVLRQIRFWRAELKQVIKVGLPSGILSCFFSLSNIIIQSSINQFGPQVIAAAATAGSLEGFVYTSMNAISNSVVTFAGQNYGARRFDRIGRTMAISTGLICLLSAAWTALYYTKGVTLAGLFTNDSMVVQYAGERLIIILPLYFVCGTIEVFVGGMRGMGYSVTPMVANFFCICVFRIIWVLTVCRSYASPNLLYASWPISWVINVVVDGVLFGLIFAKERHRKYAIEPTDAN